MRPGLKICSEPFGSTPEVFASSSVERFLLAPLTWLSVCPCFKRASRTAISDFAAYTRAYKDLTKNFKSQPGRQLLALSGSRWTRSHADPHSIRVCHEHADGLIQRRHNLPVRPLFNASSKEFIVSWRRWNFRTSLEQRRTRSSAHPLLDAVPFGCFDFRLPPLFAPFDDDA